MTGFWYEQGMYHMVKQYDALTNVDWVTDVTAGNVKGILTNVEPNFTDENYEDVEGELSGESGYDAGGRALMTPGVSLTIVDEDRFLLFDADDLTWPSFGNGPCQYLIIYKDTGEISTSPLICWHDFGSPQVGGGGDFTYQFDVLGGVCRIKILHP